MKPLIVLLKSKQHLSIIKMLMTCDNKSDTTTYSASFVAKINRSTADFESGKFQVVRTEDLWQ